MTTSRVIALLCEPEQRQRAISNQLRGPETEVMLCANTDDLYRLAKSTLIDAVIVNQQLTGFLSGLDVLARLFADHVRPVSILLGDLTPAEQVQADSLRLSTVLPAETATDRIAAVTHSALVTRVHGVSIPHAARLLVRNADTIVPAPHHIVRIAGLLVDPNASAAALAGEIAKDSRTVDEFLKLVHCSSTKSSIQALRVEDAVNATGIQPTAALVLSSYLFGTERFRPSALPAAVERRLSFRSLMMGATAFTYAKRAGQAAPDVAYVLSLLQDLGVMVLSHELGSKYRRILSRCASVAHLQLASYEQQELGYTHAEVSAAVLQNWELPPALVRLVLSHHRRIEIFEGPPDERELLRAMQVAEAVADFKDQATPQRRVLLHRNVAQWGRMDEAELRDCVAQAVVKTNELGQLFHIGVPNRTESQQLIEQLAEGSDVVPAVAAVDDGADVAFPSSLRIVALLDDPQLAQNLEEWLRGTEFELITGHDSANIRDASQSAGAILCHLNEGAEQCVELFESLRNDGIHAPMVVISADRSRHSVIRSIESGASEYLLQPLDRQTLLDKLRRHLAGHADAVV